MKAQTFTLARDILSGKWLVSNPEMMMRLAMDFLSKAPVSLGSRGARLEDYMEPSEKNPTQKPKNKRCVIVPLRGVMTKYETCESYGTQALSERIKYLVDQPDVIGLILDIDSGGGSASAVPPMIEAIRYCKSLGKPIYAHVDECGSAAYWVATQCDAIYMDNLLSEAGSVGALMSMVDSRAQNPTTGEKNIVVYAKESTDKNLSYREALEGRFELAQDELSPLVAEFQKAVTEGRPNLKKDEKGVLSGALFPAAKAIELGMADAIHTLTETAEAVFAVADI